MQEYYKTLRHLDMDSKHIAAAVTEGALQEAGFCWQAGQSYGNLPY